MDYIITGPGVKANRAASAETTLRIHDEFNDHLIELGASKVLSDCMLKMMWSHTRCHKAHSLNSRSHFRKNQKYYKNIKYWHHKGEMKQLSGATAL